jgi:hypothetical protein
MDGTERADTLTQRAGRVSVRLGQQNRELVAAQTPNAVRDTHALREHTSHLDQDAVARRVSILVVDLFEVVQIDHQQGESTRPTP